MPLFIRRIAQQFGVVLVIGNLIASPLVAQVNRELPTDVEEFASEFESRLRSLNNESASAYADEFRATWTGEGIRSSDKFQIILQTNRLIRAGWLFVPQVMTYMRAALSVRNGSARIALSAQEFFPVTDSVIKHYDRGDGVAYLLTLEKFVQQAVIFENAHYRWLFTQREPRLQFITEKNSLGEVVRRYPKLNFTNTDIIFHSRTDTTKIRGTHGYLNLFDRNFHGEGGYYDWSRLGQDPGDLYVQLNSFTIDLKLPRFRADSVTFHYKSQLSNPLRGILEENIIHYEDVNNAEYPYFRSTEGVIKIPNFAPNIDYKGGFSLQGLTKIAIGTPDNLATLTVYKAETRQRILQLQGLEFKLNPVQMVTPEASVTFYLASGDSLYHPNMRLLYKVENQDMMLMVDRSSVMSRGPMLSSYHKMNFYFDALQWNPNRDSVIFTAFIAPEHKTFAIESIDYFDFDFFYAFKGVMQMHPVGLMYRYWKESNRKRSFLMADFFSEYDISPIEQNRFKLALPDLIGAGFITYDPETQVITLLRRCIQYGMAAARDRDYDNLQLATRVSAGPNAYLNTSTLEFTLLGCEYFNFSDSQHVDVLPQENRVFVSRDRSLTYAGKMRSGIMDFYALGAPRFQFQYDNWKIFCDSLDFIRFRPERHVSRRESPPTTYSFTRLETALSKLRIDGVFGAIYINRPDNRSSLQPSHEYPVFDCYTQSFKYWNDTTKWNSGIYLKDLLHFKLDPFVLDSLESMDIRSLEFQGEFFASDIFPAFRDTLKPVRDDTYGVFAHTNAMYEPARRDSATVPLYGGKGKFYNNLIMDGSAMWGNGSIYYLNTIAICDSFVFHLDSVFSARFTQQFRLAGGQHQTANNPALEVGQVRYVWYPREDRLELRTAGEAADFFNGQAKFRGKIRITPTGVEADGTMEIGNVTIESHSFTLNENSVDAAEGTYIITDPEIPTKHVFKGNNVAVHYDIGTHNSQFTSVRSGVNNMEFTGHKWASSLGVGQFDRQAGRLVLTRLETQPVARFQTSNPEQRNLNFVADTAVLELATNEVSIAGADSILVADAVVYPKNGNVRLNPAGKIPTLSQSTLVANRQTRFHTLAEGEVNITSGIAYTAKAKYEYKNFGEGNSNLLNFNNIIVQADTTTRGSATVLETQKFFVTNRIMFKGNVEMVAGQRFLNFNGRVRIQSKNPELAESWFTFVDTCVNPDSVFVRFIGEPQLMAGVVHHKPMLNFYSNFLQARAHPREDVDVLVAEGFVTVDPNSLEYRLGQRSRLDGSRLTGNVVTYNDSLRRVSSQGYFKLPLHMAENVPTKMEMAGVWTQTQGSNDADIRGFVGLTFPGITTNMMGILSDRMLGTTSGNPDVDVTDRVFHEGIAELISRTDTTEAGIQKLLGTLQDMASVRQFNAGKHLTQHFVLGNLPIRYCSSPKVKSFLGYGSEVALISMGGETFNKQVKARFQLSEGRRQGNTNTYRSDTIRLHIEFDPEGFDWLYLEWHGNSVFMNSSQTAFGSLVQEIQEKQARKAPRAGELAFFVATESMKERFIAYMSGYIQNGCELRGGGGFMPEPDQPDTAAPAPNGAGAPGSPTPQAPAPRNGNAPNTGTENPGNATPPNPNSAPGNAPPPPTEGPTPGGN